MRPAMILRASAHKPLIHFLGKRSFPADALDPAKHAARHRHPMAPSELPASFTEVRATSNAPKAVAFDKSLPPGYVWDRDELPARFHRLPFSDIEAEAIDSGGASIVF